MPVKKSHYKKKPEEDQEEEVVEPVDLSGIEEAKEDILETVNQEKTVCKHCNGEGRTTAITTHQYTKQPKVVVVPCVCYTSKVVSSEYKLLQHLDDQYLEDETKFDKRLNVNFKNLESIPNYIINGTYDDLLISIKHLIMLHRFVLDKPRILFSRSIDIVHDFHVPQDDGVSRHLSATSVFDLAVIVFGSMEVNKAVSPCMIQMVTTRLDEKKPTWIYFTDVLTPKSQEYSQEIVELIAKYFKRITVETNIALRKGKQSASKLFASQFKI